MWSRDTAEGPQYRNHPTFKPIGVVKTGFGRETQVNKAGNKGRRACLKELEGCISWLKQWFMMARRERRHQGSEHNMANQQEETGWWPTVLVW